MALQPHDRLILLCARTSPGEDVRERIREGVARGLDWSRLLARAEELEMTPLVGRNLGRVEGSLVPAKVRGELARRSRLVLGNNLVLAGELAALARYFRAREIPVVPLKGIVLAEAVYGHIGLRPMCDLDLLVRREDVGRAVSAITELGFSVESPVPTSGGDFERRRDVRLSRVVHGNPVWIELHWKFKDTFFRLREDLLWQHLSDFRWQGESLRILSPEATLVHLAHHLNYHGYTLKILVDVAETLRAYGRALDWDTVLRLVRESGMARSFLAALACASWVLGAFFPREARALDRENEGRRAWPSSLVARERWFFGRRGRTVQDDPHLRALLSTLFVDGGALAPAAALLGRVASLARRGRSERAPGGSSLPGLTLPRHAACLARGMARLLLCPGSSEAT